MTQDLQVTNHRFYKQYVKTYIDKLFSVCASNQLGNQRI